MELLESFELRQPDRSVVMALVDSLMVELRSVLRDSLDKLTVSVPLESEASVWESAFSADEAF